MYYEWIDRHRDHWNRIESSETDLLNLTSWLFIIVQNLFDGSRIGLTNRPGTIKDPHQKDHWATLHTTYKTDSKWTILKAKIDFWCSFKIMYAIYTYIYTTLCVSGSFVLWGFQDFLKITLFMYILPVLHSIQDGSPNRITPSPPRWKHQILTIQATRELPLWFPYITSIVMSPWNNSDHFINMI